MTFKGPDPAYVIAFFEWGRERGARTRGMSVDPRPLLPRHPPRDPDDDDENIDRSRPLLPR